MKLCIATTIVRRFAHYGEAVSVATEMKQFAKRESGSSYAVDRRFYREHGMGDWLTLRFRLTAVASMSCFLAAGAT